MSATLNIFDGFNQQFPLYEDRLQHIMHIIGCKTICKICYPKPGVDFQQQTGTWQCGYIMCIIAENILNEKNLFFDDDEILKWRQNAYVLLKSTHINVTDYAKDDDHLKQISADATHLCDFDDEPTTSSAVIRRNNRTVEQPTSSTTGKLRIEPSDMRGQYIILNNEDLICLTLSVHTQKVERLWITDNIITAIFCAKILVDDFMRRGEKKNLFVNPLIWSQSEVDITLLTQWPYTLDSSEHCLPTVPSYIDHWEKVFIPIHVHNHYFVAIGDFESKTVMIYDGKNHKRPEIHEKLIHIMRLLGCDECVILYAVCYQDYPKQDDGWTCGLNLLLTSNRILSGENLLFTRNELLQWRSDINNLLRKFSDNDPIPAERLFEMCIEIDKKNVEALL
jgi:hypothetical protein